jgi:hypothetical protein
MNGNVGQNFRLYFSNQRESSIFYPNFLTQYRENVCVGLCEYDF